MTQKRHRQEKPINSPYTIDMTDAILIMLEPNIRNNGIKAISLSSRSQRLFFVGRRMFGVGCGAPGGIADQRIK
jgi:hypothetical protein